jgi:hypothetical protein
VLLPWTPLSPSRRERALRRAACALGLVAAATLLAAAFRTQPAEPLPLAAAVLAAAGALVAGRRARPLPFEVGVDARGRLVGRRRRPGAEEQRLQCAFAAPWLITLGCGTMWIPIWPDSVSRNTFRRLWVHIRWSSGRDPVDLPAAAPPGQPK